MEIEHKTQLALKVCHLYYEDELSQNEIAKKLDISRPTISRLLSYAKEQKLINIKISDPMKDIDELTKQLKSKYQLKDVLITYDASNDEELINQKLGDLASNYLKRIIKDGDSIGISWGKTIQAVADHLHESSANNISIVQLKGSVSISEMNNFANDIIKKFNNAFHTNAITLPLPVIFDNSITKDIVLKDRFVSEIIRKGIETNIALFTCGTVRDDAMLFNLGYFNKSEIKTLQKQAVGDIVSRFITEDGKIANQNINDRTVGIQLNDLGKKEYSILVAGSKKKINSIHGALVGGHANVLIIDSGTALELLQK